MIDLSSGGETATVPLPGGATLTLTEPTAADLLKLESWLRQDRAAGGAKHWDDVQAIVLKPHDPVDLLTTLTIGGFTRLVWWLWIRWTRGEEAADDWDANQGKALALELMQRPAMTSTSTAAGSTTSRRASTSRTTSRKKSPASSPAAAKAPPGQSSGTGGTSSSPTSTSATASTSTPVDPEPGSSPNGPRPGSPTASSTS